MRCTFTFVCNGETPYTTDEVAVNVNPMGANVGNSIETALRSQHQTKKPGSYLEITSITCEGLTAEDGDKNLYNKPLMKFADSGGVYNFTIIGKYDFKPPVSLANQVKQNNMFGFFTGTGGRRRRSRKIRKSRKSRKSRR
jgi:hypothetical protein